MWSGRSTFGGRLPSWRTHADGEAGRSQEPPVTREDLIKGLQEDLSREYQAIIAYVVYSQALKGAEYQSIAKELEVHAGEELAHAITIAKQIDYLGGMPNATALPVKLTDKRRGDAARRSRRTRTTPSAPIASASRQADALGEFAISEEIREILRQEQEHQIDLATALGEDVPDVSKMEGKKLRSKLQANCEKSCSHGMTAAKTVERRQARQHAMHAGGVQARRRTRTPAASRRSGPARSGDHDPRREDWIAFSARAEPLDRRIGQHAVSKLQQDEDARARGAASCCLRRARAMPLMTGQYMRDSPKLVCSAGDLRMRLRAGGSGLGISRPNPEPKSQVLLAYFLVILRFVTVASVLCAKRMP